MKLSSTQKQILLKLECSGDSYREDLAFSAGVSKPALTMALKALTEQGLVLERAEANGKVGRNRSVLSLNPDYGRFLSIDFKPSSSVLLLSSFGGKVLKEEKFADFALLKEVLPSYLEEKPFYAGITFRGERPEFERNPEIQRILQFFKERKIPYTALNNVDALAANYRMLHPEAKSFLLIKYGPGLGSAVYVHGEPVENREGGRSEIGHVSLKDGRKLEDVLSFRNLFGEEVSEEEGSKRLSENKEFCGEVLTYLGLAVADADAFLCLDSIVLSGLFLSKEDVREKLSEKISSFSEAFRSEKLIPYPDYAGQNRLKGIFAAFSAYLDRL